MFVRANFVDIHLQGMRDRSMRSGTELAREMQLTDWSTVGNLSYRSSGVQIPRGICTRLRRYLYPVKCSWIIIIINVLLYKLALYKFICKFSLILRSRTVILKLHLIFYLHVSI